jgi:hypothetical protein
LLVPEIDRQQAEGQRVAFRADAAFARPEIHEALEARGVQYAIRIPANNNLELPVEDVLFRSPGRPSLKPLIRYKSFHYQAGGSCCRGAELVADESPAAPRQDRWAAGQALPVLLAPAAESHLTRRLFGSMLQRI